MTAAPPAPDHLAIWCELRRTVPWPEASGTDTRNEPVLGRRDGAAHYIQTVEHERDPVRAERMLAALARLRSDESAGRQLDFAVLAGWQSLVLAVAEPAFRTGPAFAKGGRECYGIDSGTRQRFDQCLAQSAESGLSPAARAARAYLDVCFFHPFDDGNARAALLTLIFVLARSGIVLDQVGPIKSLARYADDPETAVELTRLVTVLVDATRRRALRADL